MNGAPITQDSFPRSLALSREVGTQILKWLGIDTRRVKSFKIEGSAETALTVTLVKYVDAPSGGLEPVTQEFMLVPADSKVYQETTALRDEIRNYQPIQISPKDAALIESRKGELTGVIKAHGIPPELVSGKDPVPKPDCQPSLQGVPIQFREFL